MLISEILIRKDYVKLQITELRRHLTGNNQTTDVNKTLTKLYALEDEEQKYRMLLDKVNRQLEVEIGTSKVFVSTAMELARNTYNKIEVITELIAANKDSLDIFNLLEQRAKLMEEWVMIYKAIKINDWGHSID